MQQNPRLTFSSLFPKNGAAGSSSAGSWCLSLAALSHFVLLYTVTGWKEDGSAGGPTLAPLRQPVHLLLSTH